MEIKHQLNNRVIDSLGRVIFNDDGLSELLLMGKDISGLYCEKSDEVEKFNKYSDKKLKYVDDIDQESFDRERTTHWFTPDSYKNLDIFNLLIDKCQNDDQRLRVIEELNMYEERQLIPLLKHLVYIIDEFRKNSIVWGIGRGSSVSSYVLYLIGVHKVDSIKYSLDIRDFLK